MGNFAKQRRYDLYEDEGGLFSQVVKWAGENEDLIFVSGQAANDATGKVVGVGDIKAQTVQTFENIKALLQEAGAKFEDVVKVTYYVKDMKDIPQIREVRKQYLKKDRYPVATTVEISKLFNEDFLIEIEVIAIVGHF